MGMIRKTCLLLASALLLQGAAHAQYIGGRPPAPPPMPVAGANETPEAALARNVRLLAINPKDYNALLGAGRAALRLGDAEAAIGFFGRAEEIGSNQWAPKAGQGSAMAQMGEGTTALGLFEQAQRLGATQFSIALDRGLAFDVVGRQAEAQSDYRAVLSGPDADEARRRLALSLAISGRKTEALTLLDPLIARRDPAARRARAFVQALTGDLVGARQAIAAMMPGRSAGFEPFLQRLATLGPGQKAAAVQLGILPPEGAAMASVEPAPVIAAPTPVRSAPPRARTGSKVAVTYVPTPAPAPATAPDPVPTTRLADLETTLVSLPATNAAPPPPAPKPIVETRRPAKAPVKVAEAKVADTACTPLRGRKGSTAKCDPKPAAPVKLASIDTACLKLKGTARTRCEAKPMGLVAAENDAKACAKLKGSAKTKCETKLAAADKADDDEAKACAKLKGSAKTKCETKLATAAKAEDDDAKACAKLKGSARTKCQSKLAAKDEEEAKPAKSSGGSRIYVQLAGGSNTDQMVKEFAKIRAKKASLFKGRAPVVAAMKGWSRLLIGPFKSDDEAQEFVNDLHAAKLQGFAWTAPGGIKLEKLASK
ncbi:hypothetical protein GCM10022281_03850 [Sphingomonas rosea]|uniref:SPOR domain-containing protein n=1 Tax=Sphingomonas rosea TaxID=335605 RepID=A0ABP7TM71_9SPHN